MSQFDVKMTELADKIKSKNTAVTGKLSIQGMIDAVGNISSGAELPDGITVTPADVKDNVFYIDGKGNKVEGEMPVHKTVNVTLTDSEQTLDTGYYDSIVIPALPAGGTGDSTVKFGYWTEDGKFQEVDLSGDSPVDSGEPVAVNAVMFDTGKDAPDYGGGGEDNFYMATSFVGVLSTIEVTAGQVATYMEEYPVSLVGVYNIVDPGAKGTDRVWVCNATTAEEGVTVSTKVYLRAFDYPNGWDDETGEETYEKRWGFSGYNDTYADSAYIYSSSYTGESPFGITAYSVGMDTDSVVVMPAFAAATDEPPYGPTAWNGKKMSWQEREIYLTYGDDCLPSCVGYWVRQDSGELTTNSSWINPISGAVLRLKDRSNEYRNWGIYAYLDYYKGVGLVYNAGGDSFDENGPIPDPWMRRYTSALYNVMPQGELFMATGTEGWYPADTETTGLEIKKNAPEIGKVYNKDATVRIGAMYPAK